MNTLKSRRAGVTLIEILIAVTLLSFLSVGVLLAMRVGFNTMGKVNGRLAADRRTAYASRIIENEIAGFTMSDAEFRPRTPQSVRIPFHQFEPQTMRFVTSFSLQNGWRGAPQIAAMQVIGGADGKGVRLIVNESPYTGPESAGIAVASIDPTGLAHYTPVNPEAGSFVLADRLEYCRFSYLEPLPEEPFERWRPDWIDGRLPRGVRIEMAPLHPSPGELHVLSVTVPIFVRRTQGAAYSDNQ